MNIKDSNGCCCEKMRTKMTAVQGTLRGEVRPGINSPRRTHRPSGGKVQGFATHRTLFLVIVFTFVMEFRMEAYAW